MIPCSRNITPEELSRYYTSPHDESVMELATHVADCPACQEILRQYARMVQKFQRETIPVNPERLWQDVRFHITETRGNPMQRNVFSFVGIVAVVIVVVLAAVLVQHSKSTPPVTATIHPLKPDPANGWVEAKAVNYGKSITFGVNQPLTGYVCGNMNTSESAAPGDPSAAIEFGVTHDGGRTWSTPKTITDAFGITCGVTASPYNANDVIVVSHLCVLGVCTAFGTKAYRSMDGGKNWKLLMLPSDIGTDNITFSFIWNGNTLYTFLQTLNAFEPHRLAVSKNGSALVWMNEDGLPPSSTYVYIDSIRMWHDILYAAAYIGDADQKIFHLTYFATTDDGAHWTTANVPCTSKLTVAENGKELICEDFFGAYSTSRDDGKTWQQVQIDGKTLQGFHMIGTTLDGTLYGNNMETTGFDGPVGATYVLLPGSTQWTKMLALSYLQQFNTMTVSSDAQGHPLALWYVEYSEGYSRSGIAYHAT
jgi:hypothetical protein